MKFSFFGTHFLIYTAIFCIISNVVNADQKADALLKTVIDNYKGLKTLSGTLTTQLGANGRLRVQEKVELKKPNLARVVTKRFGIKDPEGSVSTAFEILRVSDGKFLWVAAKPYTTYRKIALDPKSNVLTSLSVMMQVFYTPDFLVELAHKSDTGVIRQGCYIGGQKLDGGDYQVVEVTVVLKPADFENSVLRKVKLFIGKDKLIHRAESTSVTDETTGAFVDTSQYIETLTDIHIGTTFPASDFQYTPLKGAKEVTAE